VTKEQQHCLLVAIEWLDQAWLKDQIGGSLAELIHRERSAARVSVVQSLQPVLDFRTILLQGRRYVAVSDLREALQTGSREG